MGSVRADVYYIYTHSSETVTFTTAFKTVVSAVQKIDIAWFLHVRIFQPRMKLMHPADRLVNVTK